MDTHLNRRNASDLLAQALLLGNSINRMIEILRHAEPSATTEKFMESIGLITSHNADVIMGIRKLFPDLHPMFDDLK